MSCLAAKPGDGAHQEHISTFTGAEKNNICEIVQREASNNSPGYYSLPFVNNHRGCIRNTGQDESRGQRGNFIPQHDIFIERHLQPVSEDYSSEVLRHDNVPPVS